MFTAMTVLVAALAAAVLLGSATPLSAILTSLNWKMAVSPSR